MFTELDVVNEMLSTMGVVPLNALNEDSPDVANCRRILDICNKSIQGEGWWFNKEEVTLIADAASGYIYVPNDAVSIDIVEERGPYQSSIRGRRVYNNKDNTFVYPQNHKVVCRYVRLIPFKDLPVLAQRVVMLSAVIKFQQAYDADNTKTQMYMQEYGQAYINLKSEHIRNQNSSLLWRRSAVNTLNRINGYRNRW